MKVGGLGAAQGLCSQGSRWARHGCQGGWNGTLPLFDLLLLGQELWLLAPTWYT